MDTEVSKFVKDYDKEKVALDDKAHRKGLMRKKVEAMGRLGKIFKTLKEEHETILKIKNMAPDGKIPRGLLLKGKPAIRNAFKMFQVTKRLDQDNEKRPRVHKV